MPLHPRVVDSLCVRWPRFSGAACYYALLVWPVDRAPGEGAVKVVPPGRDAQKAVTGLRPGTAHRCRVLSFEEPPVRTQLRCVWNFRRHPP